MDQMLRMAVLERDRYCPVCGKHLDGAVAVHHRKLRSQGGTDSMSNLLGLHSLCHHKVHMNPAWSYERGYLVKSWDDPETVEVQRGNNAW